MFIRELLFPKLECYQIFLNDKNDIIYAMFILFIKSYYTNMTYLKWPDLSLQFQCTEIKFIFTSNMFKL